MANLKNIVYLSEEQYRTLKSTGTLTVGDLTLTYDINTMYVTDDKIAEELANLGHRVQYVENGLTQAQTDIEQLQINVTELAPDVARALKTPMVAPATTKLVGVNTTNDQEMITIGDNLSLENGVLSATGGGGTGGTSDYNDLTNKPQINNVTLTGNQSLDDLGIVLPTVTRLPSGV